LKEASSPADLSRIIQEGFFKWFNGDDLVESPPNYDKIAQEIWDACQRFSAESRPK
jgi:hypothetical protein